MDTTPLPPLVDGDAPLSMTPPTEVEETPLPEPAPEPDHIVLFVGGGHMSQEAARLARYAGFAVDVLDVREEYATEERFPEARRVQLCESYEDITLEYSVDARHYIVILTHSFETDLEVLTQALHTSARYIGVAGSSRKKEKLFAELRSQGVPNTELACVRCPIGLPIGAESAEEMAIAIAGELVAARAGCLPRPQRRRKGAGADTDASTSAR